jgi:hypothetical protein
VNLLRWHKAHRGPRDHLQRRRLCWWPARTRAPLASPARRCCARAWCARAWPPRATRGASRSRRALPWRARAARWYSASTRAPRWTTALGGSVELREGIDASVHSGDGDQSLRRRGARHQPGRRGRRRAGGGWPRRVQYGRRDARHQRVRHGDSSGRVLEETANAGRAVWRAAAPRSAPPRRAAAARFRLLPARPWRAASAT